MLKIGLDLSIEYRNRSEIGTPQTPDKPDESNCESHEKKVPNVETHEKIVKEETPQSSMMREFVRNVLVEYIHTDSLKEKLNEDVIQYSKHSPKK